MKLSQSAVKTAKQFPADETSKNAQFLIRAGFIHKTMAGVYAMLPLGLRVLNAIENIVRKHMNSIGGQEIRMNSLHPKSLWTQTGRFETVDVLFTLQSQTGMTYALAPTHEEQITPLIKSYIQSYSDLPEYKEGEQMPVAIYQIQTKFRDELRAKAGLMRGREFTMKDLYDFHPTKESQEAYFELVTRTYQTCFKELGLTSYIVDASGGSFSDKFSREFQVACDAGEDVTFAVEGTDRAYNQEVAPSQAPHYDYGTNDAAMEEVYNIDITGVDGLCELLHIDKERTTKTIFFETDTHELIAAVVRGTHDINQEKLEKVVQQGTLTLASQETIMKYTGAERGFAGLVHLPNSVKVFCDDSLKDAYDFETGCNKTGYHAIHVQFDRDVVRPDTFYDIKTVQSGDIHPELQKPYQSFTSVEVGNIFDLGQKWTKAFDVTYTDATNESRYPYMGCHGIGVTRLMGVIAELYCDEKGLKWPESVAPFKFHMITHFDTEDTEINERIQSIATRLYEGELFLYHNQNAQWVLLDPHNIDDISRFTFEEVESMSQKHDILWDDRVNMGMGQRFHDADLIGCPYRIVISPRTIRSGKMIEVTSR